MERNVGGLDRTARIVAGPIAGVVGIFALAGLLPIGTIPGAVLLVVGLVLLGTGVTQRCLLHSLLGINTCQRR